MMSGFFTLRRSVRAIPFRAIFRSLGDTNISSGDDAYRLYLETLDQIKGIQEDIERSKSERLFNAWNKSSSAGCSNVDVKRDHQKRDDIDYHSDRIRRQAKNSGVAVVRTLARESKKSISQHSPVHELNSRAVQFLTTAAQKFQHPGAMVQLANIILEHNKDKTDAQKIDSHATSSITLPESSMSSIETALEYYRRAGEQGLSAGWFNLGHVLWTGVDAGAIDIAPNPEKALACFHKAIALEDYDAMYFVGLYTLGLDQSEGSKVHHDTKKLRNAIRWVEEAASSGHGGALYYSTVFYLNGYRPLDIAPCGKVEFVDRLEAAIKHDESGEAHFLRGSCYYNGSSWHARDISMALSDFLKASDLGHADAAVNAGAILHHGSAMFRIPADQPTAFQLYQRAGELGSIEGWRNVVACYATGQGVKQSTETAKYIAETMLAKKTIH